MKYLLEHCSLKPLTKELSVSLADFLCEKEPEIQKFFRSEALDYAQARMGSTYCFVNEEMCVVAAFCVACASVSTDEMPKSMRNKVNRNIPYIKQRETYPAVLLAQIAIDDRFVDLHIGDEMMELIKAWIVRYASQIAGRFLVVDAINNAKVIDYYQRNSFRMVFASEEEEKEFCEIDAQQPLKTRFMITDLKLNTD